MKTLTLQTSQQDEMVDITAKISAAVRESGIQNGLVVIYSPHTTAGIAINENADPDVRHDVLMRLDEIFPWSHPKYQHAEGNSASHLKALTVGSSQTVIVREGKLLLGRWQSIYFCEFDGPPRALCSRESSRGLATQKASASCGGIPRPGAICVNGSAGSQAGSRRNIRETD